LQRSTYLKRRKEIAQEAMARLIAEAVPSQIKCRSQIIGDMRVRAADAIVELAEAAADLIVLASHGQSGWGRIFFGSVAEEKKKLSLVALAGGVLVAVIIVMSEA